MRNDFIKYLTDNNTNPIDYFGPVEVYTEEFPGDYEEDDDDFDDLWGDKDNIYDYQANVNNIIGSLRERLADAVFSRNPAHRQKKLERIILEIQRAVVPIRPDDGNTPRYENTRKTSFHHNKKHNL